MEGDLLNSLTAYRYYPKVLLDEKVLRFARLTPAPLQVKESLSEYLARFLFCLLTFMLIPFIVGS